MHRIFFKFSLLLFFLVVNINLAIADCWNVLRNDGSVLQTSDIWHIRDKIVEHPQSQLMGKDNGKNEIIATSRIDSIIVEEVDNGWLSSNNYLANITLRDGQHKSLMMSQSLRYQKSSEHKGNLPLQDIVRITHCTNIVSEPGKKLVNVVKPATVDNSALTIHLKNGDTVRGKLIADINWKSAYGVLKVKAAQVQRLDYSAAKASGIIILKSGDHIIGMPVDTKLSIHLSIGQDIELPLQNIQAITSPSGPIQ